MDLSDHIHSILSQMGDQNTYLPSIEGVEEVHLDVYVAKMVLGDGYKRLDIELSADDIQRLFVLGAGVRVSIVD
ncbi:MAG: hypothetical protein IPK27_15680 [Rhodanobacteraceae bacterium]|nr:hypothetical protein [Rhodanobacteraceae bacterium]